MPQDNKAPVQGIHATEYISVMDIDKPAILDELFETKGDQWYGFFNKIIQAWGFENPVNQESYSHYEDDDYARPIRVGVGGVAGATGGSQVAFTVPLAVGDVFTNGIGGKSIFPRVGDMVLWPNNLGSAIKNLQGHVVAVAPTTSPATITVKLNKAAWSTPATPEGTNLIVFSGAFAEGTGQPKGTTRNIRKRSNNLQKIKETWEGTGTEMTNGKWITYTSGGRDINAFYAYGMSQVDYMMMLKTDGALLFGQPTDTSAPGIVDPLPEATGRFLSTTKGLYHSIVDDGGNVMPYPIGSFSIDKFNEGAQWVEDERAGNMQMVLHSFGLGIELEDLLVDYLKDTDVSYVAGENTEKVVRVGFRGIHKAGITYAFKKLDSLSNTNTYRNTGFEDKQNMAFVMPVGKSLGYDDSRRSGASMRPLFGLRYKSHAGYNRKSEVYEINGTMHRPALRPVISQDIDNLYSRADIGFHMMCANKFQIWQGQ